MRSAVRDPQAPCSELRHQWQNLNVQASTRSVNRPLNKAVLKARRRTFLRLACAVGRKQTSLQLLYLLVGREPFSVTLYGWACSAYGDPFQDSVVQG